MLPTTGNADAEDTRPLERLKKIIQQQQLRIDTQTEPIEELQKQPKQCRLTKGL